MQKRGKVMREGNSKIERIQKSSRAAFIATNVIKVLVIVCSVISLVSGCVVIGMRGIINLALENRSEVAVILQDEVMPLLSLRNLGSSLIEKEQYAETIGIYVIVLGIVMACMAVVLHFVSKVFKAFMVSYSPFQDEIIKNLKIAFALITVFIMQSSLGFAVIVALTSLCVINIFEYGCELQKQSDETL